MGIHQIKFMALILKHKQLQSFFFFTLLFLKAINLIKILKQSKIHTHFIFPDNDLC